MPTVLVIDRTYARQKSPRRWASTPYLGGLMVLAADEGGWDVVRVSNHARTGQQLPQILSHHDSETVAEAVARQLLGLER